MDFIGKAILDGVYLAHQGKWCADYGLRAFLKMQKNGGRIPGPLQAICLLMGLKKEDMGEFSLMYWGSSPSSMYANLPENYTYRVNEKIAGSDSEVYLWCGSREPYARKSHRILKKYLKNHKETVRPGMGHGKMLFAYTGRYVQDIKATIDEISRIPE